MRLDHELLKRELDDDVIKACADGLTRDVCKQMFDEGISDLISDLERRGRWIEEHPHAWSCKGGGE
mgnify:CR=1 FL=1